MYIHGFPGIFEASTRRQAVVMLVHRGGDHALPLQVTDEATRQDVCLAGGIKVVQCEHRLSEAKHGYLPPVHERAHPGARQDIIEVADTRPSLAHARASTRLRRSARVAGRI